METKNQTPVEWLVDKIKLKYNDIDFYHIKKEIEKSKQMEKGQIIDAVNYGCSDWGSWKDAEQYYNETYGK
jgi:hypothetical protein